MCVCLDVWVDDWEEAYQTLRQVVKDYLLLDEQEEGENNNRASPDDTSTGVYLFCCRSSSLTPTRAFVIVKPETQSSVRC